MKSFCLTVLSAFISSILIAQEKTAEVDINVNKDGGGSFWGSYWVWIVGAAIFILLLVAVSRGRSRG